jgi:hypothetical protein
MESIRKAAKEILRGESFSKYMRRERLRRLGAMAGVERRAEQIKIGSR